MGQALLVGLGGSNFHLSNNIMSYFPFNKNYCAGVNISSICTQVFNIYFS